MEPQNLFSNKLQIENWKLALAVQPLFLFCFFLVFGFQQQIRTYLSDRGFGDWLVSLVSVAFLKYGILLILTAFFLGALAYIVGSRKWFASLHPVTPVVLSFFAHVLVVLRCMQFPMSVDDSYIDYRYVLNWISGQGLVYNPGEHIMGFTSTVHLWVLAALSHLLPTIEISVLSQSFNVCLELISYLILFRLCLFLFGKEYLALLSSIMLAISPDVIEESLTGKETSIVIFLLLLSIFAAQTHRLRLLAWGSTLLFLSRPEGIVAVAVALPFTFNRKQPRDLIDIWFLPGLLAIGWYAFLLYYFGTIIPHGAIGKALTYHPKAVGTTLIDLIIHFGLFINQLPILVVMKTPMVLLTEGLLVAAAIFQFFRGPGLRFYAFLIAAVAAFFSVSNPLMFPWYYAWFQLVTVFLLPLLIRAVLNVQRLNVRVRQAVAIVCVCYFAALPFAERQGTSGGILLNLLFTWTPLSERVAIYREAADYCNTEKITDDIASGEIGMFGNVWKNHVTDLAGLVSDSVLKYYPVPKEKRSSFFYSVPVRLADEMAPKYLLVFDQFLENGLANDENFHKNYFVRKSWPLRVWGSKALELYERNDKAVPGTMPTASLTSKTPPSSNTSPSSNAPAVLSAPPAPATMPAATGAPPK